MEPTNPSQPTNETSETPPTASVVDSVVKPVDVTTSEPGSTATTEAPKDVSISSPVASAAPEVSAPAPAEPAVTPVAVINGVQQSPAGVTAASTAPGGKKKWIVPALAAGALVAILGGGYVFGMYLPNRPGALFSKSLTNSAQAADKLVEYSKAQMNAKYTGATMDGTMALKSASASLDATMNGKTDGKNGEMTVNANVAGQKMKLEIRGVDAAQSDSPDLYLKVSGVKEILQQMGSAQLAALDSQWIAVDHTLVDTYKKQLEQSTGTSASLNTTPTPAQVQDAVAKAQEVNKQYLFSSDKDTAVLQYKSFVGKETVGGRSVNHYKVGYNKQHLSAYVDALAKALDSSKLNDWVKQQNDGKNVSEIMNIKSLKSDIENLKGDETFDVNVDTGTKLVQSVTFAMKDAKNPGTLTLAQNYTGGDSYPFQLAVKTTGSDNPTNLTLDLVSNTKSNKLDVTIKGDMGSGTTLDMVAHITPTKDKVTETAPTGAKPVTDVMKQLGLDPNVLGASTSSPSSLLSL